MKILSMGDEVREGTYRLHSRFRRAVNFTDGRRVVTLVTPDIGAGPVNIVVRDLTPFDSLCALDPNVTLAPVPNPDPDSCPSPFLSQLPGQVRSRSRPRRTPSRAGNADLRVERYSVVFANRRFLLNETQSYGSLLHIEKETSRVVFRKNLKIVENILVEESHPKSLAFLLDHNRERNFRSAFDREFVAHIKDGAARPFSVAGVRRLAGCGFGLTPSGDDYIAGTLIGLNVLQLVTGQDHRPLAKRIFAAAAGKNLLANSFLRLARDGRVSERMLALVCALSGHACATLRRQTRFVMAAGGTSGADLLTGFVMAVKRY
jgi:hypothetical protein